jgi:hypothetical protein
MTIAPAAQDACAERSETAIFRWFSGLVPDPVHSS